MSRALGMIGLVVAGVVAGCASPVVGGECREGYAVCDGMCVELAYDPEHCGQCGNDCGGGAVCIEGSCEVLDASVPDDGGVPADGGDAGVPADGGGDAGDAGSGDGGVTVDAGDAGSGDGGVTVDAGDAGSGDGGVPPSCDVGEILCGDTCVDPDTDPTSCGDCGTVCGQDEFCAAGMCTPFCEEPLTQCGGECVDVLTDADHCGGCGSPCASGICADGTCSVGEVGHVVVIGHDYVTSRVGMRWVAGNAVFLASGNPVRVLVYEGRARPAAIEGVDQAIEQVAQGRTWERTVASADRVPLQLATADVLVIPSQHGSTDAALTELGADWALALDTFVRSGGVVVLFDGGGAHSGTWQLLDAAGLFLASGRAEVSGDRLEVTSPGDAVAVNVPRSYRAEDNTVRFQTDESSWVVEHSDGPVVIHRVVFP